MIKKFKKGEDVDLSENFKLSDFDCKCTFPNCKITYIDTDLVCGLDFLCDLFAKLNINSGFRCSAHNEAVGGKPGSCHLAGKAADVSSQFADPKTIYYAADKIKLFYDGGIGIYSNWIHLDVRGHRSRWNMQNFNS